MRQAHSTQKTNQIGNERLLFTKIGNGAAKTVLIPNKDAFLLDKDSSEIQNKAYYIPREAFFKNTKKELKEEVEMCKKINENTEHKGKQFLALDLTKVEKEHRINKKYTVETTSAEKDLEKAIKEPRALATRILDGVQYLMGLSALHDSNHVYGDTKPENCLVYSDRIKISDFGKTKENSNESQKCVGNMRFAPPEGLSSKAGDVYSAGLMLIRFIEEEFLDPTHSSPLVDVLEKDLDIRASNDLRRLEKYMVEHKSFTACESRGWLGMIRSRYRRVFKLGKLSSEGQTAQQTALNLYINKLIEKLEEAGKSKEECEGLKQLLKSMTDSSPTNRPKAQEAADKYSAIFQ